MKHNYILLTLAFVFAFAFSQMSLNAQSLSYSGPNSYDITSPTHIGEYLIPSLENSITGMAYGDNGNKFYTIGSTDDKVIEYNLSTAYDVSTKGPIQNYFNVAPQESIPQALLFNVAGTKMYILGNQGDDITEYTLSTAWDVSSAGSPLIAFDAETAIDTYFGTTANGDLLTGMTFNNDGSKLYIADRRSDDVFEFNLSTEYDISTAGAVVNNMVITGEANVRSIAFNDDGMELYVIGNEGDDVNVFPLSIAYDLSSVGTSTSHTLPSSPDNVPQALLLNNTGTVFYVGGSQDDEIREYSLSADYDFSSTIAYVTSFKPTAIETTPQGMVFNNDGTKIFVVGESSGTIIEISLSTPYDIATGALTAALDVSGDDTEMTGLAFNNTGTTLFVTGKVSHSIYGYDLSSAYDLSSTITTTTGSPVDITSDETQPSDIFFNTDGTKLYVLGNNGDDLNQYSLSPGYDLTDAITANLDIAYDLSGIDALPLGMAFNSDGSKLYIAGTVGNYINEISLENNFDLSTGVITNTNTFSIASEEEGIRDVIFNGDGSKFYICGTNGEDINEYQTKGLLPETPNDGSIDAVTTPFLITLTGDTFVDLGTGELTDTQVTVAGVPEGLTAVLTLNSATEAQLSFTGKANSHLNSDEAAVNLSFTFTDAAFTTSNAVDVSLAVAYTNFLGFDYIECADNEIVYDGSAWTGGNNSGTPDDSGTDLLKSIRVQGDILITANTNCDCLQVESGQTLTVADGIELTVANSLELEGDIRLLGSAQLVQTHTGVKNASGTGNLYKDVKGTLSNVFQSGYWTSPVTTDGVTYNISGVLKDGTTPLAATGTPPDITFVAGYDGDHTTDPITLSAFWLNKFVNSTAWTEIDETTEINPGEGFNKKSTGNGTGQNYTFVGRPNDGDYEYSITGGNYSLYGNPYASPIDADAFTTDNSTSILGGTLHFYQAGIDFSHVTAEYTGGYATRAGGMGNAAAELGGVGAKIPGQYMSIGQAFFVEASVAGGTIIFNNNQRDFNSSTEFFSKSADAKATTDFPILRIGFEFAIDNDTYHRQVSVGLRGLTDGYENGYEGEMWDYKSTDMALKVNGKDLPYAITGIEDFDSSLKIPLQVKTDSDRDVTFKIDENLSLDTTIYLFDSLTEIYYNITSQEAIISLTSGTYNDRFFITFSETVLGVQDTELSKITILNKNSTLFINATDLLDQVVIYNILGQNVATINNVLKEQEIKVSTSGFKTGVYIVKAKNAKGSFTKKIMIK